MKENLQLKTKVKVANPVDTSKYAELEVIIDTGAAFSIIKRERLIRLGISPFDRIKLKLANGQIIERERGGAYFEIEGKGRGVSDVIFGEEGDAEVIGLLTLEGMALTLDMKTGELKPIEVLFM